MPSSNDCSALSLKLALQHSTKQKLHPGSMATLSDESVQILQAGGFSISQINALSQIISPVADSIVAVASNVDSVVYGINSGWLVICGAMVFIMHGGFAMVRGVRLYALAENIHDG
jgi:hypothetical protein